MHIQKYARPLLALTLALALSLSPVLRVSATSSSGQATGSLAGRGQTTVDGVTYIDGNGVTSLSTPLVYTDSVEISYINIKTGAALSQQYNASFRTTHPVVAYYREDPKMFVVKMYDPEKHKLVPASDSDYVCRTGDYYQINGKGETTLRKHVSSVSWHDPEYSAHAASFWGGTLNDKGSILKFTGKLFKDEASMKAFVETGDTSGLVKLGEELDGSTERDFSTEFDPSVPVPKLSNISHSGFHVDNAAEDLELDAVVYSQSMYLFHVDPDMVLGFLPKTLFQMGNAKWKQHYKDLTSSYEVGYYKSDYDLAKDFKYDNAQILADDANLYKTQFPSHRDLDDYDSIKHMQSAYDLDYEQRFRNTGKGNEEFLSRTMTGMTKYYVRFYKLDYSTGKMTPGQWQYYEVYYDGNGNRKYAHSPVVGEEDGTPYLPDVEYGRDDGNGGIDYSPPGFDADLTGILGNLTGMLESLTSFFGDFPQFLAETFTFIPSFIWDIVGIGFTIIIVTAFFKMLK